MITVYDWTLPSPSLPLSPPTPLFQKLPSVSVLGVKRSNIITIALSSLPPPHLLPPAIYTMDCSVLDREDVQVESPLQTTIMTHCIF